MSEYKSKLAPSAIVIHCSDSLWGDAETINRWHLRRGFDRIGYHYVILNGTRVSRQYIMRENGMIEKGRLDDEKGAHCEAQGMNSKALGICLIGRSGMFTDPQMRALTLLVHSLMARHGIKAENVNGHGFYDPANKVFCPGFEVQDWLKQWIPKPEAAPPPPEGWAV